MGQTLSSFRYRRWTYHQLGHIVPWCGLACKKYNPRVDLLALRRGHALDRQIAMDDTKDIHRLALVLVDTLDLDIEHGLGVDSNAEGGLDVCRKPLLVIGLGCRPLLLEDRVAVMLQQPLEFVEVFEPCVGAKGLSDEFRECGVALIKPATGGNPFSCHSRRGDRDQIRTEA